MTFDPRRRAARPFFALALGMMGLVSGFAAAPGCNTPSANPEQRSSRACPPDKPCNVNLTFLHTADIHSRLFPYDLQIAQSDADLGLGPSSEVRNVGGVARMAYVVERERARAGRVIHVEGGDCFQGAPVFNFFKGEPELRALGYMGVDAMSIANHEFDLGAINAARQVQKWAPFPVLAANYKLYPAELPSSPMLATVLKPYTVVEVDGLKVAIIGMGNFSSLSSVFEQPNRLGILPLESAEVAQGYVDLLRPYVDLVVLTTHLGLENDEDVIHNTTGIDIVFGSHNHIVLNPPKTVQDCTADPSTPGFIWSPDPNRPADPKAPPPNDEQHPDPENHPWQFRRACKPRTVPLVHSGAFAKFVGRLDVVVSNEPTEASPTRNPADYEPVNRFEVVTSSYVPIPITADVPENAAVTELLEPYLRRLDVVADLDILVGYSPQGLRRGTTSGGDSPLGNLIARAMWLRLGVQTEFAMTNSAGIRQDLLPGPVTVEQLYNIFPFDNTITKMLLSGREVQEVFDFTARRSAGRGCRTQVQIAGARVVFNCASCSRKPRCESDQECEDQRAGTCDLSTKQCTRPGPCAEAVYIGSTGTECTSDADCKGPNGETLLNACDKPESAEKGRCLSPIVDTNVYELATSNYLAGGGSGFRVLQRNTTQIDTLIQQRDALSDYVRQGKPCGYSDDWGTEDGMKACSTDEDCADVPGGFVCSCPGKVAETAQGDGSVSCRSDGACEANAGRCVRADCRNDVATFHARRCASAKNKPACQASLNACSLAGESCKVLSCIDGTLGAFSDNRIFPVSR